MTCKRCGAEDAVALPYLPEGGREAREEGGVVVDAGDWQYVHYCQSCLLTLGVEAAIEKEKK